MKIFSQIDLKSYIQNPTKTKLKNVALMQPKYEEWFSSTRPILDQVLLNGEIYTKKENQAIQTKIAYSKYLTASQLFHRDISDIFDITLEWVERGYHLIEKEFLIEYDQETVIYIGKIGAAFNILLDLYPDITFVVFAEDSVVPLRQNVVNEHDIELLNFSKYQNMLLISHLNDLTETERLVNKLSPQKALIRFKPTKDILYYEGELITLPFSAKTNEMSYLITAAENKVNYNYNDYLNRIYYHNLVIRQWHQFDHVIKNTKQNKHKPNRDDQAIDRCYDCKREVEIHTQFLKAHDSDFNVQMIKDEIDNLTATISTFKHPSLYKPPHSVYPSYQITVRRINLKNFKPEIETIRKRGRRIRY